MTIRLVTPDSSLQAKADTAFIHGQVTTRAGPYPPSDTLETIDLRLQKPGFICMIDDANGTVAGFQVRELARDVVVIWWLPRAALAGDNMPQLVPVLGTTCQEVLKRWPTAGGWPIYGDYPGKGDTPSQRRRSSRDMVDAWVVYFNSTPAGIVAERGLNPHNNTQFRPVSTVKQMAEFAAWVMING